MVVVGGHFQVLSRKKIRRIFNYKAVVLFQNSAKPPAAVTIFFGANDAAILGRQSERQHVPTDEYKENLRKIVLHLKVQILFLYS